jgi:hypothetical protein
MDFESRGLDEKLRSGHLENNLHLDVARVGRDLSVSR